MPTTAEIDRRFTFRAPTRETIPLHEEVNAMVLKLAHRLAEIMPEGRESALSLTALQEVRMWANCAIATATPKAGEG